MTVVTTGSAASRASAISRNSAGSVVNHTSYVMPKDMDAAPSASPQYPGRMTQTHSQPGNVSGDTTSADQRSVVVPDKPALEGLEAKWSERWKADETYKFDRTR